MNEKCYTVYEHISPNGKRYIGITRIKPQYRWNYGKAYKNNKHFYNAIVKYGWDNFQHNIIFSNLSKEVAEEKEKELIKYYNTYKREFGYNQDLGGNSRGKLGKEHLEKLSKSHTGIKWSEEAKKNLSNSLKGRKISDEQKQKLRIYRLGSKMGEEQKKKISTKLKGRAFSQETLEKMRISARNRKPSEKSIELLKRSVKQRRKYVINIEQNMVYESLTQASMVNNVSKSRISECCRGIVYSYKNTHWYFYDVKNNKIIYPQKLIDKWDTDKAKGRNPKWTNRGVPEFYKEK